jgi:hypothetical protein
VTPKTVDRWLRFQTVDHGNPQGSQADMQWQLASLWSTLWFGDRVRATRHLKEGIYQYRHSDWHHADPYSGKLGVRRFSHRMQNKSQCQSLGNKLITGKREWDWTWLWKIPDRSPWNIEWTKVKPAKFNDGNNVIALYRV